MYNQDLTEFPEYTHEQLMRILQRSVIDVLVSFEDLQAIWAALEFDWRKDGMHGRIISRPLIVFNYRSQSYVTLLKFDRLEVGGSCRDVHCDSHSLCGVSPFRILLWRKNLDANFSYHCRLWDYFRLEYLMVDDLHTLDLGACARLGGHALGLAITSGKVYGNDRSEAGVKKGCIMATRDLRAWQKQNPSRKACTIKRLNLATLGLASDINGQAHLSCKAGESRAFLPFALFVAKKMQAEFGEKGQHLVVAIDSLEKCYQMMHSDLRKIDYDGLGDLLDKCLEHSRLAGVRLINKFHLMRHLRSLGKVAGNPAKYSAYIDESKNADTVKLAQKAKTWDFNARILAKDFLQFHAPRTVM